MKRRLRMCALFVLALAGAAGLRAETFPYDHLHFGVPDPPKAVEWYLTNMGAKRGDSPDRVVIGRTIFAFTKSETAKPSTGSSVDHFGLSVADVDAKMKALEAAGGKVVSAPRDVPGLFKLGFIEDPWGAKIELVQDPETPGFHHIHLRVPDPEASLQWYIANFGGERTKLKGRVDGVKYANPAVWILAQKGDDATPSLGHAIDHLGWAVADVDAKVAALAAKGEKTTEPRPVRHLRIAFVEGPGGVRIEMVQGRRDEELVGR